MNRRIRRAIVDATAAAHNYAREQEGAKGITAKGKKWRAIIEECYVVVLGAKPRYPRDLTAWIEHLLDQDK